MYQLIFTRGTSTTSLGVPTPSIEVTAEKVAVPKEEGKFINMFSIKYLLTLTLSSNNTFQPILNINNITKYFFKSE